MKASTVNDVSRISFPIEPMKLSDYVVRFVADQGVKHVFLVTGGGAMHLNHSLGSETAIEPVCNSHEQASAMCAEGYAKATNHLGVCMVTTGPGGTNAVTGVTGAWLDSTPMLVISGQVKRPDRMFDKDGRPLGMRQLGVQEVDIVSIVKPITKYAVTVLDANDIRYHLEKAVYLAFQGRPGPVWIDIPLDVQASPIEAPSALRGFDPRELTEPPADASLKEEVRRVLQKLNQAERPLLFAGNGIRLAHAEREFEQSGRCSKSRLWRHGAQPIWFRAMILFTLAGQVRSQHVERTSLSKTQIFFLPLVYGWISRSLDTHLRTSLVVHIWQSSILMRRNSRSSIHTCSSQFTRTQRDSSPNFLVKGILFGSRIIPHGMRVAPIGRLAIQWSPMSTASRRDQFRCFTSQR